MKVNQDMVRRIGDYKVIQRTKDGYFSATSLLESWNSVSDNPRRDLDRFLNSPKTQEFEEALIKELSFPPKCEKADIQLIKKSYIKTGGRRKAITYMNPYLFTKFAMWINPTFEAKVVIFVTDKMIEYRMESCDRYKDLTDLINKKFLSDKSTEMKQSCYKRIANLLNLICVDEIGINVQNKYGDEYHLKERVGFEERIMNAIEDGFLSTFDSVVHYMKALHRKRFPFSLWDI